MEFEFLKDEDLAGILDELYVPDENDIQMTEEMKASQRRVEEYIVKNMEN